MSAKHDERGWPIRMLDGKRVCAREKCRRGTDGSHSDGSWLRGYCSFVCEDMDELEQEIESLRSVLEAAEGYLEAREAVAVGGGSDLFAMKPKAQINLIEAIAAHREKYPKEKKS